MRTVVVTHFLVWIFLGYSCLAQSARHDSDEDPCFRAKLKDDSRRQIANVQELPGKFLCDRGLETGWYRFILNNKSAEIPTVCLPNDLCGTQLPLRVDLDGQVLPEVNQTIDASVCSSFSVLGMWDCCVLRQRTRIKNCGGFLVYYLHPSDRCPVSYCVQESGFVPPVTMRAMAGQPVAEIEQIDVQNDEPQIQDSITNAYDTNSTQLNTILMREGNYTDNYSDVTTTPMRACINDLKCGDNANVTVWMVCRDGQGCGKVCDGYPDCCDTSDEGVCPELVVCSEGRMKCPGISRCYTKCDGVHECIDGYDERHCPSDIEKNMTFNSTRQFSLTLVTSAANVASALQGNVTLKDVIHIDAVTSSTRMVSQIDVTYTTGVIDSVTSILSSLETLSSIVSSCSLVTQSQQWKGSLSGTLESTSDTSSAEMIQTISRAWNAKSAPLSSFIPDVALDSTVPNQFVLDVSESMTHDFSTVIVTVPLIKMISTSSFVTEGLKYLTESSLSTIYLVTSMVSTSTLATATDFVNEVSKVTGTSAELQSVSTTDNQMVTDSITIKSTTSADKAGNGTSISSQPGQLTTQPIITTLKIPADDTSVVLTFPVQGRIVNLTDFEERLRKAMAKVLNIYLTSGLNRTKREIGMSTVEPLPRRAYEAEDIVVSSLENTTEHIQVTLQVRALSENGSSLSFLSREELQTLLKNPEVWNMLLAELIACDNNKILITSCQRMDSFFSSVDSLVNKLCTRRLGFSEQEHVTTTSTQYPPSRNTIASEQSRSIYSSYEHPLMGSYLSATPTMSSSSSQLTTFLASSLYPVPSEYFVSSDSILIQPLGDLHLTFSVNEFDRDSSSISTYPIIPDRTHEVQFTNIYHTPTEQTRIIFSVTPSQPIRRKPGSLVSSRTHITKPSKTRQLHTSFESTTLLFSESLPLSLKTAVFLTSQPHFGTKSSSDSYQTGDLISLNTTSRPYHTTSKSSTFKSPTKSAPKSPRLHQSSSVIPSRTLTTSDETMQVPVTSDLENSAIIATSLHNNATYLIPADDDDWTVLGIHLGLFIFVVVSGIVVIGAIIFVTIGLILRKQHQSWSPIFDDRISVMKHARFDRHGLESPFPDSDILRDEKMMEENGPGLQSNGATPLTSDPEYVTSDPSNLDGCVVPIDQLRPEEMKFPWIEDTKL